MERDILEEVARLRAARRPFALATVVAAKQPTSGAPGARAIIHAGGEIEGWLGGQCVQPSVVRLGLAALADGSPRLLILSPSDEQATEEADAGAGVVQVPMLCASKGELQIFVEPFLPRIDLVVIGATPVARALARLGAVLDFDVWACDPEADMDSFPDATRLVSDLAALAPQLAAHSYVVVATMNAYDEDAAQAALASDAAYVGVVASERRFAALRDALAARGLPPDRLARLKRPKGLPGSARVPGEIAFSVMAELLDARRQRLGLDVDTSTETSAAPARETATDPICGMAVDVATARHTSERGGVRYYFCCAGCKAAFDAR